MYRYVDDSVSPEEIMKKFEELDAIQKKKAELAKTVNAFISENDKQNVVNGEGTADEIGEDEWG